MKFSVFPLVSRVFLIVSWSIFIATTLESLIIPTSLSSQHWHPLFFPSHFEILLVILMVFKKWYIVQQKSIPDNHVQTNDPRREHWTCTLIH